MKTTLKRVTGVLASKYLLPSVLLFTVAAHAAEPARAGKSEGSPEYPVVRHDLLLSDADCGHAAVTLTHRGRLISGAYAVCGRQTLNFLWRPQAGLLTLSTSGVRFGDAYVNLAKKTWSSDPIFLPVLSSSWGREINLIIGVLAKAGPAGRSPRTDFVQDPWDPFPGDEDDPNCMGHYMDWQMNNCQPCTPVRWFYADSRYASYSNGYKSAGTNNCGCNKETSCTNL